MRGIGKSSIGKTSPARSLLLTSAAFAFVSTIAMLAPTQASAQFGGIDGIIRGALGHGGYGYRGGGTRHSSHSSSHHDSSDKDDDADTKPSDKPSDGKSTRGSGSPQSASSDAPPPPPKGGGPAGAPAGGSSGGPPKPPSPPSDEPAFTPSR
jgi:hypothetical protein